MSYIGPEEKRRSKFEIARIVLGPVIALVGLIIAFQMSPHVSVYVSLGIILITFLIGYLILPKGLRDLIPGDET